MVVDLDAFDANAADLRRRAGGTPIRLASKSVRVPALIRRALDQEGFRGVLAYTLAEALWLEEHEVSATTWSSPTRRSTGPPWRGSSGSPRGRRPDHR